MLAAKFAKRLRSLIQWPAEVQRRLQALEGAAHRERERLDHALGLCEGVMERFDAFQASRASEAHRAAFAARDPLVTVCVATMNRAELLTERALASLRAQTHRNIQILVVGDHCTDDTEYRVAELRDDRISFVNLPRRGPYPPPGIDRWRVAGTNAMNAALAMAEGAFVTHLDDDDRATPDRIETLLRAAQEDEADLCWHPFWAESAEGAWSVIGNGRFELGQISTGSIFYHRALAAVPWDVHAYRSGEPGDWNRLRKIRMLRPRMRFVPSPLLYHFKERNQAPFTAQPGETFLP